MKTIKTKDAVGHVLYHDITQIIKDEKKGVRFKKGHVIKEEDIPVLLSLGKDNIYVWEKIPGMIHENDAAEILYNICADSDMYGSEIKEGKIDIFAAHDGLLSVELDVLNEINAIPEIIIATRASHFPVKKGDKLAGTRIIPLIVDENILSKAKEIAGDKKILKLHRFKPMKVGVVTTGNEVYYNRIKDTFTPVIEEKLAEFGVKIEKQVLLPDDSEDLTRNILEMIEKDCLDMVICTGGMSVDPDDRTPLGIKNTGADIVRYGSPVLPGAMFMLAYKNGVPIMGLPGCVMYSKRTIFDIILPRVISGIEVAKKDIDKLGHGGLCLDCSVCIFPNCGFGKGV